MVKKDVFRALIPVYVLVFSLCIMITAYTNRVVTAMAESAVLPSRRVIVIDAGHGGVDGGATSCTGVLESQINLQISQRLNDLLHLLGYNTLMLRTSDVSLHTSGETIAAKKVSDLKYRVNTINQTNNALLVSIHQNYFGDSRYSGAQVFYAQTDGSKDLAVKMQQHLGTYLDTGNKRQVKMASGIYLMEHIACTGVLVECGFLSNPVEEAKLRDQTYQMKLSCVIASSVAMYLDR